MQVRQQLAMQPGQVLQSDFGERAPLRGILLLDPAQHALDQITGQFEVERQFDDLCPAPAVFLAEVFPGHLCQIELDCAAQHFDVVAEAAYFQGDRRLRSTQYSLHGDQHTFDKVTQTQSFAYGIGQRQTRGH
ncbi:hypothetical protein D3C84_752310 [compost metagenome]